MSTLLTIQPKILFSYPSAKDFTNVLKTISEIVEEVLFEVSTSGLSVKALDPSRVALLRVELPAEAFQEFKAEQELKIGLAVGNLVKVLKNLKKGDKITIAANEEFVEVVVEGTTTRRYKFRNIEVMSEEVPEIKPEFDVEASATASVVRTIISELASLTSTIGLSATKDALVFIDLDTKKVSHRITQASGNLISLNLKKEEQITVPYDSEYLSKIVDILRLGSVVDIKFGSEAPLYMALQFSGGKAEYLLAAKI
jgi:proliferating cell nuclear antigen